MSERRPRREKVPGKHHIYRRTTADGRKVYEVGWKADGRKHYRTVEGGMMAAEAERDRILGSRAKGEPAPANPRLRFAEAAQDWLEHLERRANRARPRARSTTL